MRAGNLNRRIIIQERTETQDSMGGVTWTWAEVCTVWAEISAVNGREFISAQQVNPAADTIIRIRYRSGLAPKMRAVEDHCEDALTYDIQAVLPNRKRTEIQLMCLTRYAEGWRE